MTQNTPPTFAHWPVGLVSAALLSGALIRCGPGVRPAGWPDSPLTRCAALGAIVGERYVAIEETAAWVWGTHVDPGTTITVSIMNGRVPPRDRDWVTRKQLRFARGDVSRLGNGWVTTPQRTAFDLLRSESVLSPGSVEAIQLLIRLAGVRTDQLIDRARTSSKSDFGRVRAHLTELDRASL